MQPVNEYPPLPQAVPQTLHGMIDSYGTLLRQLIAVFSNFGFRLNRVLPKDGSEAMTGSLEFEPGTGPVLVAPNGTKYQLVVDNSGNLSTTPV